MYSALLEAHDISLVWVTSHGVAPLRGTEAGMLAPEIEE